MSLATGGLGGGLSGLSHTAGFNQLSTHIPADEPLDYEVIDAKPIQGQDLTTDQYAQDDGSVEHVEKYPHISIDLYSDTKDIVYHSPLVISGESKLVCLGKHVDGNVYIKRTEQSYKVLRKFLRSECTEELYQQVLDNCLVNSAPEEKDAVCIIQEPYLLLGTRRIELLNEVTVSKYSIIESSASKTSNAIEPLTNNDTKKSNVYIRNQTLDGSNIINNNDYDRVAFQIHVLDTKKPLFFLPEEIVSLQLAMVRKIVQDDIKVRFSHEDEEGISFLDYPIGLPIPSYMFSDAVSEAILEACNVIPNGDHFMTNKELQNHRCLSAIEGEIVRMYNGTGEHKLLQTVRNYFPKQKKKLAKKFEIEDSEDEVVTEDSLPVVYFIGITSIGIEGVAFQTSADLTYIKCLSETGYQSSDALNDVEKVLKDLKSSVGKLLPKKYRKPAAILTHGSLSSQIKLHAKLKELIANEESSFSSWKKTVLVSSKEEVIAYGACIQATKTVIDLSQNIKDVDIKPVSNTCVGVRISNDKDAPIKVIFDFDRRVPAGPYKMELSAAEYVAKEILNKEEVTEKEIDTYGGKKYIPQREVMAKGLKVQVYQRMERDGIWVPVGDVLKPLVKVETKEGEDGEEKEEVVACESSTLQLSLSPNGVLTASVSGNFESVVQALKKSRSERIQYYGILITVVTLCIYFFVKSVVDDYQFKRDLKRLLHYYKIAAPNTFHDGDLWNARYLVWKYRGRRHVLWRRLEVKYGVPVPESWEDEDDKDYDFNDGEEEDEEQEEKKDEF